MQDDPDQPGYEARRLTELRTLNLLDSPREAVFDQIAEAAASVCGTPMAAITLIDDQRQWFKSIVGLEGLAETPREIAFCNHTIRQEGLFEVADALQDERFRGNPLVTGQPGIRFYAGVPLRLPSGVQIGAVAVIDRQPRHLSAAQHASLEHLARVASEAVVQRERARLQSVSASISSIVQQSDDAVVGMARDGSVTSWNVGAVRLFGYRAEEIRGHPFSLLVPEDQLSLHEASLSQVLQRQPVARADRLRRSRDGRLVDVALSMAPILDDEGRVIGAVAIMRDISQRRRAEQGLRDSEARYRLLVETQADFVSTATPGGLLTFVNAAYAAHFGRTPGEMTGTSLYDWVPADERAAVRAYLEGLCLAGGWGEGENRFTGADGQLRWVHWRNQAVTNDAGKVVALHSFGRDITERRRLEQELARARADLQAIMDHSPVMISSWSADGHNRFANRSYAQWYGTTPEALLGRHASEILSADAYAHSEPYLRRALQGQVQSFERDSPAPDGSARFSLVECVPVKGGDADTGPFVFVTDITRRVLAERQVADHAARFQALYERTPVMMHSIDRDGVLLSVSDAWLRTLGYAREEVLGRRSTEFLTAESRQYAREVVIPEFFRTGRTDAVSYRMVCRDGRVLDVLLSAVSEFGPDGGFERSLAVMQDVTARRQAERELAEQHELLRVTLESIGDAVITTDAAGRITWLNPVAERMTGWRASEAGELPLDQVFRVVNARTRLPAANPAARCLAIGQAVAPDAETVLLSRDGREYGVEDSAAPIRAADGSVVGAVMVFRDVSEQRRLAGEMHWRATHDALTGLINRSEFDHRLDQTFARVQVEGGSHALLYIDLDQFKLVNDACGHAVGDELLRRVSRLLADSLRKRDSLARLGGDEFAALLEHCTLDQAERVARKICEQMEEFRFVHDGRHFRIGASIGAVPVDGRWTSASSILQAADASCYAAKEAGRNRVHTWYDSDTAMRARHGETQWATRIEHALQEDRFRLYAQVIQPVSGADGQLRAEVLLRMEETDGVIIAAGMFLPAAERFHLATRLDRWVVRQVLAFLAGLDAGAAIAMVSVNLSGQSIGDRSFHQRVLELLAAARPLDRQRLCFEITETAAVTHLADASAFIEAVRALGVKFALDDFGAGASSFGYLKSLRVDCIKIDGGFIRDLLDDPLDDAAVRCFVDVARVLGVTTVAEFVESDALLERVRALGVDLAQGYALGRPAPLQEVAGRQ